jgi:hypothetical protein
MTKLTGFAVHGPTDFPQRTQLTLCVSRRQLTEPHALGRNGRPRHG